MIDDDRDFVRLMSRMLNSRVRRHQIISAYSGQEGLAMLHHRQPDLILLDLVLPDMDGFQVVEHIRSSSAWRHTPIVVVSAQDDLGSKAALTGAMSITRADGLVPGEVVQWVQAVLDTATRTQTSQEVKADPQVASSLAI